MMANGMLAGLVAITAPCAFVRPAISALIGIISGVLVIEAVLFVERKLKVDETVGAIAVDGVKGTFGVLCVVLFANVSYGAGWNSGVAASSATALKTALRSPAIHHLHSSLPRLTHEQGAAGVCSFPAGLCGGEFAERAVLPAENFGARLCVPPRPSPSTTKPAGTTPSGLSDGSVERVASSVGEGSMVVLLVHEYLDEVLGPDDMPSAPVNRPARTLTTASW